MIRWHGAAWPILLLTLSGCRGAGVEHQPEPPQAAARAHYLYGPVRGRLQTPTGGNPGTTTRGRPTLNELGFDRAGIPDLSISVSKGVHEVYAGYRYFRLSGSSTLDRPLVSQGKSFAAGTRVDADVALDWFRAGYRHGFFIDLPGENTPNLTLSPGAGAAIWKFDYRLRQSGGDDVHRSYLLPAPQAAFAAEWPVNDRLSLTAELLASIPVASVPRIYSGQVGAAYSLVERGGWQLALELVVGFDRIEYNDSRRQQVPNDISVDAGPYLGGGFSVRF
jgi:hypothetical protein